MSSLPGISRLRKLFRSTPAEAAPGSTRLDDYVSGIDLFNRSQPNAELLEAIRRYNHTGVSALAGLRNLRGKRILDLGASPHGYALEKALELGAAEYIGIGLDVGLAAVVDGPEGCGRLLRMDATRLDFPSEHFDLILSLSTFEHVSDVAAVLAELRRVLKTGGEALIEFEPIWTCSYGHHLHHFGPVSQLMPDWAHLVWNKARMIEELKAVWPPDAPLSLEAAATWTFEGEEINRIGIGPMREYFRNCGLKVESMTPLPDAPRDPGRLQSIASSTGLNPEDLITKGLKVHLTST